MGLFHSKVKTHLLLFANRGTKEFMELKERLEALAPEFTGKVKYIWEPDYTCKTIDSNWFVSFICMCCFGHLEIWTHWFMLSFINTVGHKSNITTWSNVFWAKFTKQKLSSSSCSWWLMEQRSPTRGHWITLASSLRTSHKLASMMATLTWNGSYLRERFLLSVCGTSVSPSCEGSWRWAEISHCSP